MEFPQRWIGTGSSSNVYELVDHDPPAVLKSTHCSTKAQQKDYENEYATLKKLKHPNIVRYIRSEQIDEYRFGIVMEYCRLGSLKTVISDPTITYTMNTVVRWGQQLFEALGYMYREHKFIHRDIKPENIFIADTWILKLGDFGTTRIVDQTCTGTFTGTQRYMSPPQFDRTKKEWEQMETNLQNSHRNDVYSLGLTVWEIIERRTVFDEYDLKTTLDHAGSFNREKFLVDVILKKLEKLKKPKCQDEIGNIVENCTNFDRSSRSNAEEIITMLANLKEDHELIASLEFFPQKAANQKKLCRPIGFNGKREMIFISESFDAEDFASFEEASVSQRNHNCFRRNPEFIGEYDAPLMCIYEEIVSCQAPTSTNSLSEKLLSLYEEKKQQGYEFHKKDALQRELREKLANRKAWIDPIVVFLELWLLNDIYCQLECFSWFFDFLNPLKGHHLSPWSDYQMMGNYVRWLEELKAIRYTVPINFKRFFQKSTYQEWLQIAENENLFVQKSLLETKLFQGNWSKHGPNEYLIFERESDDLDESFLDSDAMTFLSTESVYLSEFLQAAREKKRTFSKIVKFLKMEYKNIELTMETPKIQSFTPPIPKYFFQLRNPPRFTCTCAIKCPTQPFEPLKSIYQLSHLSFEPLTVEMKIPVYECSSQEMLDYLSLYYAILNLFHLAEIGSAENPIYPKIKTQNFENFFKTKTNCFLFLNYSNDHFIEMFFLDHPDNYEGPERVPCLDFTLTYRSLEFSKAKQFVDETPMIRRTWTLINHCLEAQIVGYDGKAFSGWFDLEDETSWPKELREQTVITEVHERKTRKVKRNRFIEAIRVWRRHL